jgi:predicted Zn-dependent protease
VRIYKGGSNYGRPGNLSIRILIDLEPNAYILPNGAILISTGLLSTINSEDELMGILAHEIAHFILDHPMVNYNKEVDRKKRAEFWAAFASIAAVSADAYLTFKNENHIPGILTATTMVAATVISDQVTTRLGIKYSREQEAKADLAASEVIESLGYDKVALSVALQRLKNYYLKTGNYLAISSSGTHPSIESRIQAIGIPTDLEKFNQAKYLKNVSLINSHNAWIELWTKGQPLLAYDLVQKNISSGVATEKDYIVKAVILRRNATTKEELEEVLTILQKAKMLNVTSEIQIHKEEGLTQLRLNNIVEAKRSFQLYLKQLEEFKIRNHLDEVEKRFTALEDEIQWTQKMIFKSDKF